MDVDKPLGKVLKFPGKSLPEPESDDDVAVVIDLEPGDEGFDPDVQEDQDRKDSEEKSRSQKFDGNLAEDLDPSEVSMISMKLFHQIEEDLSSRDKWSDTYKDSLRVLGIENEERNDPWPDACNIVHSGMLQGIVRFQSRALGKLYSSQGPAAISIRGVTLTPDIQQLVSNAQEALNTHLTEVMQEGQTEIDRLLFHLAQIGFAAVKVFYDDDMLGRVTTVFIEAENLILPYGTDSLETAQRFTHEMRLERDEFDNLVISGKFLDVGFPPSTNETTNSIEEAKEKITGQSPEMTLDDSVRIYECYVNLKIDADKYGDNRRRSPYIVTLDKINPSTVYSIRRNWKKGDKLRRKRSNFAIYRYVPSDGSYAYGLAHLTGQLIKAATRIKRELIDAGELSNLPGILRSRAARMKSQDPVAPGEFREVDLDPDQLKNAFFPMPFKEPSQTLIALLEMIIGEIKDFTSTADLDISASSQNAPVGTTLALIERQTEISNAVQKRLHTSFSRQLTIVVDYIREYEPKVYAKIFGPLESALNGQGTMVIHAFGDPSTSTMSQRVIQLQALIQAAQQAPGVYDLAALHRALITAMGINDAALLVPDKTQVQEQGIVQEHMSLLNGKPIKAFADQDQKSHIAAHLAFLNDPQNAAQLGKDPRAEQLALALMAHIAEHMAFDYSNEINQQMGGQLPPDKLQDPSLEQALSQLVAQAAEQVAQQHAQAQQQKDAAAQQADPAYALEKQAQDAKEADMVAKHTIAAAKVANQKEESERKDKLQMLNIVMEGVKHAGTLSNEELQSDVEFDHRAQELAASIGSDLLSHSQHLDKMDHSANQLDVQQQQNEAQNQQAQAELEAQNNQPQAGQ